MHIVSHADIELKARAAGISMRQVCIRAGVSESTMVRWKYGRLSPRLIIVQKIANALSALINERRESSSPVNGEQA